LRQLKLPPSEIRQMTYPEMKLEMLGRFEQAIEEQRARLEVEKSSNDGTRVVRPDDPDRDTHLQAIAAMVKAKQG